ncbi:hypothetical protein GJ496_001222 [Pomphorhynchus laevis]|nr:hypothetical protein GJ496_001222 [Pomphorhynchus laevis]
MKFAELGINSPTRLRDLIRNVRTARTAAEERSIAQKESAAIRDCFRNENNIWRCRNVAKLLYLYLLGYPAHFGQLECLKLIASKTFTNKRIGYLGVTLLLDEHQSTHLLITNSLKKDLKSDNNYITSVALSAMAAICSDQMCRDCLYEVEQLMTSPDVNVRKKLPEYAEFFAGRIKPLLTDKHHSTVCNGAVLLLATLEHQYDRGSSAASFVSIIIRNLKSLLVAGYNPDYDVGGISDPFLQVYLIKCIRKICSVYGQTDELTFEILAQLAGSTEATKNVSNAVLYETVLTIISLIDSNQSLRILAINILGRFLANPDKNVKYVALGTLLHIVKKDRVAVQNHQSTIAECLNDFDISVKRRAMQLTFAIIDSSNVKPLIASMIQFLSDCEQEFKGDCASDMFTCLSKYSSDIKWKIDMAIEILQQGGNFVRDDLIPRIIAIIASNCDYHKYACRHLFAVLNTDIIQQPLCQIGCWCFGEYAKELLETLSIFQNSKSDFVHNEITVKSLTDLVKSILYNTNSSSTTKAYAINCLMKINSKTNQLSISEVKQCLLSFTESTDTELQTRACEYRSALDHDESIRKEVFASMPEFVIIDEKLKIHDLESESNGMLIDHSERSEALIEFDEQPDNLPNSEIQVTKYTVVENNELIIHLKINSIGVCKYEIIAEASNQSNFDMTDFLLQVAVPKSFQLKMLPPSSKVISARSSRPVIQKLTVICPSSEQKPKVRLRVFFTRNDGERIINQADFSVP